MSKNILIINGEEKEVSSEYMRDFYESHCDSMASALVNKNNIMKDMSRKIRELERELEMYKSLAMQESESSESDAALEHNKTNKDIN
jgi:hypothetical protein